MNQFYAYLALMIVMAAVVISRLPVRKDSSAFAILVASVLWFIGGCMIFGIFLLKGDAPMFALFMTSVMGFISGLAGWLIIGCFEEVRQLIWPQAG